MNKRQRDKIYPEIVKRQHGEFCNHCERDLHDLKMDGHKSELIVDCIPNDGDHSRVEKLQLLCHSCNTKKNHPSLEEPYERTATPEMIRGTIFEKKFRRWVAGLYQENSNVGFTYEFLVNSGAEKVNCSTETIKRYLKKMASDEGMYEFEERFEVTLLILKEMYR